MVAESLMTGIHSVLSILFSLEICTNADYKLIQVAFISFLLKETSVSQNSRPTYALLLKKNQLYLY